jgi:O-antigen/teichoic acid export membrane protein
MMRYGITQVMATTTNSVNARFDQLLLSQTVLAADLGRYAIAVSLTSLAYPLVTPIGSVLFPHLAAQRAGAETDRSLQKRAMILSLVLSIVVMAPLALGAHWLIPEVFGHAYRSATTLVWILTPGGVFYACNQVAGDLLRGRHQQGKVAWAQGAGAVVTLALLFSLVPQIGVTGAAIASSASYGVSFVIVWAAVFHRPSLPPHDNPS